MPINDSSAQTFDSHIQKIGINLKSYFNSATVPVWISCLLIFVVALFSNCGTLNLIFAQIEISTDEKITSPIFNQSQNQGTQPSLDVLYSALDRNTIVGEVKNNLSYPIEQVRVTATVYDKNGVIVATGDKYVNDYLIQPGSRSGFDIFLDETLPSKSKYILTSSFEKSDDIKPETLQLSVGENSKTSNSFRVLGEVLNLGNKDANAVKVSAIFYDEQHKMVDTDYVYTNPDIISPNKKAPFEFSFRVDNPETIKSMAFNVQSDEYSLFTKNVLNDTNSQQ
jgi:SLAP domain-containing protein